MANNEYLLLFNQAGDLDIEVKFLNSQSKIANKKMTASDILKLIDPNTGKFFNEMKFDEYVLKIKRYEIDPNKNKVTIIVNR